MFKLQAKGDPKIVRGWPVTIQEPGDNGRVIQHKVTVDYKIITDAEREALVEAGNDGAFLSQVVVGWNGFKLPDDSEAPCDDANKELFFDIHFVRVALVGGYFTAAAGGRRKN